MSLAAVMKIQNFSNKISVSTAVNCAAPFANILPDQKNPTNHQNHPMNTTPSSHCNKAWRAIAAFCVLLMLALLPTSSHATVKQYRVNHKNDPNLTHQWTFEGSSPLADKKGIAPANMYPAGASANLQPGYNPADSRGIQFGDVSTAGANGLITISGNGAGNPNAVYLTTNYAFEIIFRAEEAASTAPNAGGVDKLSWLLCARSDDNTRRAYLLFQGEIGTTTGNGSGLGSIVGNSFGNAANGNRVATSLVAGHWYYVAGSYDTIPGVTTTQTHYIADLTAGETTLTVVGPVTTPVGSTAPNNEAVRFGIGTRYDGLGFARFNIEEVDLYTSNKLDQATFQAHLNDLLAAPHDVAIGGELIVDLNINRGLMLDINPVGGLQNGAYYWTNYGTAGGEFQSLRVPPFQTGRTNPLTYQVSGGTNSVYTVGGQGFESTFTMPTTVSGQSAGVGKPYTAEVWFWPNRYRTIMDRVLCFGTDPTASAACIIGYGNGRGMENGGGTGVVNWTGQSAADNALWYHMVNTYDGTTSILYTNGVEMGRNTINLNIADNRKMLLGSGNQGDPNYNNTVISAIGGFMAARVHSQALTPAQVLNNFQVGDQLPVINITVQNLAVSAVDIHSATVNGDLTVTTDPSTTELTVYYGLTDQGSSKVGWAGSVTLGAPQNTGAFSIPLTGLADNTTYTCRIYGQNDNGEGWSGVQSFTTPPQAPAILNVSSRGQPNAVFVTWDRPMNTTAINYENYELNGPLIFSATFSSGNTVVKLITETLTEGNTYTLTVNNAQDLALSLPVVPNTQKTFKHGEGYGLQAPITMKRYDGIGGTAVANLTGAGAYPNSPTSINTTLTEMRIPQDVADNYGWWMYGYFVAPENGNYNFHTASDDNSQVWITVGGIRTKVSEETGCCGGPKPTITPVNLVAGQAYLLEQLGKEGGGGDHGWVSVMSPNNLFGYQGDGNNASLAIPSSAFAQTRIGSGTPFNTLGLVFFPLPPSNHVSLVGVDYTFAATLDGTPPYSTPQWFRNGELIPGATTLSYTAAAIPANSGAVYTLMVTGVCNVASASATLTVLSDIFPPTLVSATPGPIIGGNYVDILFSEAVDTGSATESLNYEINGGALNVISATQLAPNKIRLTTDAQTRGASYAVVVNSVVDLFANTIAANSTVYFNGANFPGGLAPVVWFDASQITGLNNNDTVNTWNDSSGNNYTATGANGQRTYVTGQLNGLPVVQLRGDGFFNLTGNLLAREQYVVVRLPGGGDWGSYLGSDLRSGYMARQDGRFWNENYPDGVKQNGVNFAGAQNEGITLPNPATYMILKITGSTRNNGDTARTGWHIGKQEGWQSLNMDLAEILAFDRPLSLAEEARVSKSLGNKYGIALPYTDVLEVSSRGIATTVYVSYLDPMDSVTAGDAANYELNGPLVLAATMIDSTTVRLDVEAMADGSSHTLTITGVRKASPGNPFIAPNPSVVAFQNNYPPGGVSLGMVAWFDASRITGLADGNNVATWNDSSGNNRHASRGNGTITYSVNQVNGKPSVIFRGDPWMDLGGSSMRAHEQYIVFRTPNQGDWGAMLGSQVRGEYMMRRDGKFWDQNTPAQVKRNGVQLSNLTADNATPDIGTYMIMKIKGNNNFTADRGGWKLGKQEGWQSLDMDLAEIVAFNRELSFVEEAKVSAALGAKYGIGTPDYADVLTVSSRGNPNAVYVSYLDAMDPATAGDPGNYDLGAGPLVLGATMLDATTVKLTVETMPDTYQTYTLNINGVKKATLAYISPNPTAKQFTHGKGYENYGLTLKRYMNIGGVNVSDLTGNGAFPNNPTDTSYPIKMEIPTDAADNYGWWMYGLYIAPATGNYVFRTSSDDASQVWLSTDENPANKVKVSEQGGWNGSREYRGGATVSLVQGQKYYLEMLGKEGGGGDNGAVAAETPGNVYNFNGNGSEPIPASAFYAAGHRYNGVSFVTLGDVFFTVQPTNATVVVGYPLQMISVVDGTPPYLFQWKTNGVPIPGATNATYATLANNGLNGVQFTVCVSNEFSGTCSTNATINITSDLIAPTLVSAQGQPDLIHVILKYSEAMEAATAAEFNNYEISGGISVTGASMIDATNVLLTTSLQTPGTIYTVTVNDVRDDSSSHNPILAGASANFRSFPLVNPTYGTVLREFYENFQGNLDTYRDSSETFKNNPNNVAFQNNWNWGGCCEQYVVRLSGYIIPPVSGNYTFRVNRDDDARLFISTDETQANKGNPLISVGCCGDADTSAIALVANTPYYVEAWVREWGGGDYLRVFWKNGTTIPNFSEMDGNNIAYAANAVISQNPADQTVQANSSVTFTAAGVIGGSGHGPKFQWHVSADNGASFNPIAGATGASYTHQAGIGENGYKYRCVLSADDGVNSGTSASATLTIEADSIRPTLVSAKGDASQVILVFSEPVTMATVQEINNYSILRLPSNDGLSVLGAVQISPNSVRLTTSAQTPGVTYEVHVSFVDDTAVLANTILPDSTIQFVSKLWPGGVSDGIAVWFDASEITGLNDNDMVTTWNDRSDNGHTAIRANGELRYRVNQVNGLPAVTFRNDPWFDVAGSLLGREQYVVYRLPGGGDWGSFLGSDLRSGYLHRQDGRFWEGNYPDAVNQNGVYFPGAHNVNILLPNPGNYMVLKITGNINNGGGSARAGWHVGKQEGWQSLHMDVAEIIAYDRLLTQTEENKVGSYLALKYGISTTYPDGLPPVLVSATPACDLVSVNVTFNKAVDAGTAGNAANYSITDSAGAVLVISAATVLDSKHVSLTTAPMSAGRSYVVVVNGVTDTETPVHTIAANSTAGFTAVACSTVPGFAFRETYDGIGGNAVSDLTGSAAFIAGNPTFFDMMTQLDTGGDRAENYGIRVTGHFIPTETATYRFQLHSDDGGRVFLSTDDSQASKTLLVEENGCCGFPESPGTRNLVQGQAYYFEAYMKEGGGGDYLQLRWRTEGGGSIPNYEIIGSTHLAYRYSLAINQQPLSQTVAPGNNVTFTVGAAAGGAAIVKKYQWQRSADFGTTFDPIDGATSASYTRLVSTADENTRYRCAVSLLGNFQTEVSAVAVLNPINDDKRPTLVSAAVQFDRTKLRITFSEGVTPGTATDNNSYSITTTSGNELSVISGVMINSYTVELTTALQSPETAYVVVVNYVQDASPVHNEILPNSTISFTTSPVGLGGVLLREFYNGIGGNSIGGLTDSPAFRAGLPTSFDYINSFNSPSRGDDYGVRVSGILTPTETGNYTFQINNDDDGRIYLSTDSTQGNKVQILDHACCGTQDSAPVNLIAGQKYYIEGLVKEGDGGDYLELRWKNTGSIPAFTIIPGANLSYLYSLSIAQQPANQIYASNPGTVLLSENFSTGNGGFTVETPLAYAGPWVYNLGTGSWREDGQGPGNGQGLNESFLTSPAMVLTTAGGVTVSFNHRHSFERGFWDGGQVLISVNGGAFTLVSAVAFTQNGYNGSAIAAGSASFVEDSAGFGANTFITSSAYLGSFNNGDSIRVQFRAANDENTTGNQAPPSWEIDSVLVKQGASAPAVFTVGANQGYAAHARYQWQRSDDAGATYNPVAGAVDASYQLFPVPTDIGAKFRCEVSLIGDFQTIMSGEATLVSVTAPVPTTVTSSSFSGGAFNMSFGTVNGLTYYVECAVTLDGSVQGAGIVWQAVETISGDGQPRNVSYPQNGATKRFYRIRIQ